MFCQNEGIVDQFLSSEPNSLLLPVFPSDLSEELRVKESRDPLNQNAQTHENAANMYKNYLLEKESGKEKLTEVPRPWLYYSRGYTLNSMSPEDIRNRFTPGSDSEAAAWVRFNPAISGTSGLFVAKFTKSTVQASNFVPH
jgi:hypothetical protein